jgi:hypothetical protein
MLYSPLNFLGFDGYNLGIRNQSIPIGKTSDEKRSNNTSIGLIRISSVTHDTPIVFDAHFSG